MKTWTRILFVLAAVALFGCREEAQQEWLKKHGVKLEPESSAPAAQPAGPAQPALPAMSGADAN